jgi:DNA helicase-2/ATP-dependent DNA helicase PcrA
MPAPNELRESEIQQRIIRNIDEFNSFRFNAGAGAGKTFALVESIKHIIKDKIKKLRQQSQQAICITYTNVAVNEIKERLGNSELVLVSTIHERLWELIKFYQQELILIHLDKVEHEIQMINNKLSDETITKHKKFAELTTEEQAIFIDFVINQKETFNQILGETAPNFRSVFINMDLDKPECLVSLLSNVGHFQDTVKLIYKRSRYQRCVLRINDNLETKVTYDSKSNSDWLEYMKFSHDTLLEYGFKIIERHSILRRIIIDKYPYVFVDEYQDSDAKVIQLFNLIHDYALEENKQWLVGYFGDTAQNIYDDGVGSLIETHHPNLENIDKPFNRRSHNQIINIINKIRNDNIVQRPIFEDRNSGNISFHHSSCSDEEKHAYSLAFLEQYKIDLSNADETLITSKIHCLVLTNKLMAQLNGFGDFYESLRVADAIYWKEINTKLLSHDVEKLDQRVLLIYNLISLHQKLRKDSTTFYNILGPLNSRLSFSSVNNLITLLKNVNVTNFGDLVSEYSRILNTENLNNSLKKSLLNNTSISIEDFNSAGSLESLIQRMFGELMYKNSDDLQASEADSLRIQTLLSLPIEQFILWLDFIDEKQNSDVIYHTYHGTKGEEYDYVALLLGHSFGGTHEGRDKFKDYFKHIQMTERDRNVQLSDSKYKEKFENTKNLIYVACSRAAKNLRVLYLDDVDEIREGVEQIFSTCDEWQQP